MRLSTTLLPALHALRVHRLRSGLALLGISFGVMAVTLIVAFGAATQARLDSEIRALGADVLFVLAAPARGGRGAWRAGGTAHSITDADADAIARDIPGIIAAAPAVRGSVQVVRGNRNRATALRGVTPAMFEARPWPIVAGRPLVDEDVRRTAKVALLGHGVAAGLFPGEDPTGRVVRIGQVPFTVVGVMQEQGYTLGGDDLDDQVLIPLSTARKRVLGYFNGHPSAVGGITLRVAAGTLMEEVGPAVADLLRQRHRIASGQPDDFVVRDLAAVKRAQARSDLLVTAMLAGAAAVSLVVGGIGIMNLMLVSVSERRQEIGLRMALGARRREIAMQFMCEAGLLALVGSIAGAVIPLSVASLVGAELAVGRPETGWAVLAAVLTATLVTLVSALYPARRAASVLPAESLFR